MTKEDFLINFSEDKFRFVMEANGIFQYKLKIGFKEVEMPGSINIPIKKSTVIINIVPMLNQEFGDIHTGKELMSKTHRIFSYNVIKD
jgi:hypothetical protein